MDEIFNVVRDFIVEQVGEDMGYPMTLQAEVLTGRIRDVEWNSAKASTVFAPGERLMMLNLIRKEVRKIEKDIERIEGRIKDGTFDRDADHMNYLFNRKASLKSLYKRMGGNPNKMHEQIRRLTK